MPGRIPKPCKVCRCPHRTVLNHGYCERHQDRQLIRPPRKPPDQRRSGWTDWQQRRGNVTQRGYGHDWQKLREQVLRRDGYLCQVCKQAGRLTRAGCVDHIRPKSRGGDNALSNLQSLCRRCHQAKTLAERSGHRDQRPDSEQLVKALLSQGIQP